MTKSSSYRSRLRIATAVLTMLSLAVTALATLTSGQTMGAGAKESNAALSADQRILHVLNRLGFGARPGDVNRVKAMGVD
ncbi:MAG TPA: hypothetical protein VE863_04390, partial [Pyrinomonadaceae bacterium]|nr:hypothetical protein [Pyrinomonadaceae bacterium]